MGVVLSAGGSLQWFRNQFCRDLMDEAKIKEVEAYDLIFEGFQSIPVGAEGLIFLPYLTGERHPHSDPYARAAWIGLSVRHTRNHLARAAVEGATFAMRDCLEVMRGLGIKTRQIRLGGGGAKQALWRRMQANVYGQTVAQTNADEGPAFGVALLAMVGTGAYRTVPEACAAAIRVTEELQPEQETQDRYEKLYGEYRRLYPLLLETFQRLGSVQ
jgi:xylulokinase